MHSLKWCTDLGLQCLQSYASAYLSRWHVGLCILLFNKQTTHEHCRRIPMFVHFWRFIWPWHGHLEGQGHTIIQPFAMHWSQWLWMDWRMDKVTDGQKGQMDRQRLTTTSLYTPNLFKMEVCNCSMVLPFLFTANYPQYIKLREHNELIILAEDLTATFVSHIQFLKKTVCLTWPQVIYQLRAV